VPTRKQRRRRAKEQRHEYEYVLVDEEGHERELDPAELRAQREERAKSKEKPAAQQRKDARGRPLRPVKPPSWQRSAKRAGIFVAVLFVFLAVVPMKKKTPIYISLALALLYGAAAVPFFYWMDRMAYRRYERATGAGGEPAKRR
jgi:cell division protein FtsN